MILISTLLAQGTSPIPSVTTTAKGIENLAAPAFGQGQGEEIFAQIMANVLKFSFSFTKSTPAPFSKLSIFPFNSFPAASIIPCSVRLA